MKVGQVAADELLAGDSLDSKPRGSSRRVSGPIRPSEQLIGLLQLSRLLAGKRFAAPLFWLSDSFHRVELENSGETFQWSYWTITSSDTSASKRMAAKLDASDMIAMAPPQILRHVSGG